MKRHLGAVVVLAAIVTVPALAAARSANDVSPSAGVLAQTSANTTVVPRNGDPSEAMANAEDTYLASLCPTVMAHPGNHSALLNRFCRHG